MKKKLLKDIYFYIHERYDEVKDKPCDNCHDIDCGGNYVFKLLKKKHQIDVIDRKACLVERKKEKEVLANILRQKEFDSFRLCKCNECGKKFESEEVMDCHWLTPVENSNNFRLNSHYECFGCFQKITKRPKDFSSFKNYL